MTEFFRWVLGLKSSPDWVRGDASDWTITFQSPPEGAWRVVALLGAIAAAAGIWYLYRREGRSLSLSRRLVLGTLRGLVLLGIASMLLEMVVVYTKQERVPSHLLVLVDASPSMGLP